MDDALHSSTWMVVEPARQAKPRRPAAQLLRRLGVILRPATEQETDELRQHLIEW